MPKSKNRKGHREASLKRASRIKAEKKSFRKMIEQQFKITMLREKIAQEGKLETIDDYKD